VPGALAIVATSKPAASLSTSLLPANSGKIFRLSAKLTKKSLSAKDAKDAKEHEGKNHEQQMTRTGANQNQVVYRR
jgi:hypothetical protein